MTNCNGFFFLRCFSSPRRVRAETDFSCTGSEVTFGDAQARWGRMNPNELQVHEHKQREDDEPRSRILGVHLNFELAEELTRRYVYTTY